MTQGKWDVIAEIRAENLELLNLILGKIRTIESITGSETNILQSILKIQIPHLQAGIQSFGTECERRTLNSAIDHFVDAQHL